MATTRQKAKTKTGKAGKPEVRVFDFGIVIAILSGILFMFLAFTNQWGFRHDIELYFTLFWALIFIAVLLKKENRHVLKERATPILFVLTAHTTLFFVGMFYTPYTKFALQQFFLNIGGWFAFSAAYMEFTREEKNVRRLISVLAVCIAVISFVSVELATSRLLIGIFEFIAGRIFAFVPPDYGSFETNTRVLSVMGNPNTYAPVASIGMLFAILLSGKSGSRQKTSGFYMAVAVITGSTFILSFSMGTILTFIPTAIAVLFFSKKENRLSNAISMIYCLFFSAAGAAAVFAFLKAGVAAPLALLAISAVSGLLYVFLKPVRAREAKSGKSKALFYAAIALAFLGAAALAVSLKGPYALSAGEGFRRAVYLREGTYTVELEMAGRQEDGENPPTATVAISSMSLTEAALKEQTWLAEETVGNGGVVEFTVPEGSKAVFFKITAKSDLVLSRAAIRSEEIPSVDTGNSAGAGVIKKLPLKYRLLPEFIVNRMQAIWVNDNAIQRFVFFRDGLRIAMTSPLIGRGGGAYEALIFGAADYYYETVHTHNHYIQCFIDGGIIGLALFTALAVLSFVCLFRSGKDNKPGEDKDDIAGKEGKKGKEDKNMMAFIAGAVVMIFFHSLIEVDFSAPAFKALASVVLAVLALYREKKYRLGKIPGYAATFTVFAFTAITLLLSFGRIEAVNGVKDRPTLKSIEEAVVLDPFNRDDYMVSYLLSTMRTNNTALVNSKANEYLRRMESRSMSHDTAYLLSQYYFLRSKPDFQRGIELSEYYIREKKVNPNAWEDVFTLYLKANAVAGPEDKKLLAGSVLRLSDYLDELNASLPKEIRPKMISEMVLWANLHIEDPDSLFLLDSRYPCDRDGDGRSDLIINESGSELHWRMNLLTVDKNMYIIKVFLGPDRNPVVYIDGAILPGNYIDAAGCHLFLLVPSAEYHSVEISVEPEGEPYFTVEAVVEAG